MSVNVLPDMDEPRLKTLGKQLNRNRKSSLINTGKDKQDLDVYVKSLNKEKKSLNGKYYVRGLRLKKSLANVRGTQKVLKSRREQSFWEDSDEYPYGVYEGESLESYRRQIDHVIQEKHPKKRRMRKVEKHLESGRNTGKILDNDLVKDQFNEIMVHGRRQKRRLHRENPLTKTFLQHSFARHSTLDHLWKDPSVKHKMRVKPSYFDDDLVIDEHQHSPLDIRLNDVKGTKGVARIYTPKTETSDEEGSPIEMEAKWRRRIHTIQKSPVSNCSPYTEDSAYGEEEEFKDVLTVKSSPSKLLNLPPITATKNSLRPGHQSKEHSKNGFPNLSVRRVTKGDLKTSLSVENLQHFEKLKSRRATTFL